MTKSAHRCVANTGAEQVRGIVTWGTFVNRHLECSSARHRPFASERKSNKKLTILALYLGTNTGSNELINMWFISLGNKITSIGDHYFDVSRFLFVDDVNKSKQILTDHSVTLGNHTRCSIILAISRWF